MKVSATGITSLATSCKAMNNNKVFGKCKKRIILYFTGTGNCLYVARQLAKENDENTESSPPILPLVSNGINLYRKRNDRCTQFCPRGNYSLETGWRTGARRLRVLLCLHSELSAEGEIPQRAHLAHGHQAGE